MPEQPKFQPQEQPEEQEIQSKNDVRIQAIKYLVEKPELLDRSAEEIEGELVKQIPGFSDSGIDIEYVRRSAKEVIKKQRFEEKCKPIIGKELISEPLLLEFEDDISGKSSPIIRIKDFEFEKLKLTSAIEYDYNKRESVLVIKIQPDAGYLDELLSDPQLAEARKKVIESIKSYIERYLMFQIKLSDGDPLLEYLVQEGNLKEFFKQYAESLLAEFKKYVENLGQTQPVYYIGESWERDIIFMQAAYKGALLKLKVQEIKNKFKIHRDTVLDQINDLIRFAKGETDDTRTRFYPGWRDEDFIAVLKELAKDEELKKDEEIAILLKDYTSE